LTAGAEEVEALDAADWVIVNTCAVTRSAQAQSRQMVRRAGRARGERAAVLVTGCGVQLDPQEFAGLSGVRWVVGNAEKARIPALLLSAQTSAGAPAGVARCRGAREVRREPLEERGAHVFHGDDPTLPGFLVLGAVVPHTRARALLKVQDGCSGSCTYCIVAALRGRPRSRPLTEVVQETERLAGAGYREVVLTGINLGLYGHDLSEPGGEKGAGLARLLHALERFAGRLRVRLSSLEPMAFSGALIEAIAASPVCCPHFHLPVQSGDEQLLRRMGRPYGRREIERIVAALGRCQTRFGLGIDVIAGFPGETEASFAATLSWIEELPVTYLHAFGYSERPGTPAADFSERVAPIERKARVRRLRELDARLRLRFQERLAATRCELIVERSSGAAFAGISGEYVRMQGPGPGAPPGERLTVTAGGALRPGLQSCRPVVPAAPIDGSGVQEVPGRRPGERCAGRRRGDGE